MNWKPQNAFEETLKRILDAQELDEATAGALRYHIQGCPRCGARLRELANAPQQ